MKMLRRLADKVCLGERVLLLSGHDRRSLTEGTCRQLERVLLATSRSLMSIRRCTLVSLGHDFRQ